MKAKKDWNRQPAVDAAGDKIMAARNCPPSEVTAYQIAAELGCSANSSICEKTADWCRRRERENELGHIELPAGAEEEYRKFLAEGLERNMQAFVRMARSVGATMHQSAHLPVAAATRRAEAAEAREKTALQICKQTEADLEAARAEIERLREQLMEANKREWQLQGRLEQCRMDASRTTPSSEYELVHSKDFHLPAEGASASSEQGNGYAQESMSFEPIEKNRS